MSKKVTLTIIAFMALLTSAWSQTSTSQVRTDGMYVAKTKDVVLENGQKFEIYTYIRFSANGNVYTQSVNSYSPEKVSKWFGEKRFEKSGTYTVAKGKLSFTVNNAASADREVEGPASNTYKGTVANGEALQLKANFSKGKSGTFDFRFVKD